MNSKNIPWQFIAIFLIGLIAGFLLNKLLVPVSVNSKNLTYCQDLAKCQGKKNAPVTIVEYSDFQCPFCKKYFDETYSQLKKDYIDTGKVYYVFKDYPLPSHPEAPAAALAGNCAAEQNKFWQMHDLLFTRQDYWSSKPDHLETFKKFADELQLDQNKFTECLNSKKYDTIIEQERKEGIENRVSGTPTFFVNGTSIVGGQDYQEVFVKEIEKALAEAKKQ